MLVDVCEPASLDAGSTPAISTYKKNLPGSFLSFDRRFFVFSSYCYEPVRTPGSRCRMVTRGIKMAPKAPASSAAVEGQSDIRTHEIRDKQSLTSTIRLTDIVWSIRRSSMVKI
jgi:hypothetical protein